MSTVPVVPNGVAASSGVTWRKACYLQFHCGVFGAHRSAEKTYALMKRVVWWATMKEDINSWVGKCLTCFKARSRATKVTTKPMKPAADYCWQEVSVDCEGPNKEDYAGNRYSLTYMDCLSHAVYLEPLRALNHAEVRRAFARCVLRSRTLPTLVRSDRGPEFRSAMFAEYCALIGASQWLSHPLRPCEMGANERVHQEVQKMLGIVVKDVVRAPTIGATFSQLWSTASTRPRVLMAIRPETWTELGPWVCLWKRTYSRALWNLSRSRTGLGRFLANIRL